MPTRLPKTPVQSPNPVQPGSSLPEALLHADGAVTALAGRWASALVKLGVKAEDQVLIAPHPVFEMLAAILAVARCGARAVPMAAGLPANRLAEITTLSHARLVLNGAGGAAPQGVRQAVTLADLPDAAPTRLPPAPRGDDAAVVIFGAAGQGAVFSHAALVAGTRGLVARYGLRPSDRVLPVAPLGGAEWLTWALASLDAGATLLDAPETHPDDWYGAIAATRPTVLVIPDPQRMLALVQDEDFSATDFPALRYLRAQGPADMLRRLAQDLPQVRLINGYAPRLVAGLPV